MTLKELLMEALDALKEAGKADIALDIAKKLLLQEGEVAVAAPTRGARAPSRVKLAGAHSYTVGMTRGRVPPWVFKKAGLPEGSKSSALLAKYEKGTVLEPPTSGELALIPGEAARTAAKAPRVRKHGRLKG